ncbi:hypothetical protein HZS_2692, partial [Henneguya salminicola]
MDDGEKLLLSQREKKQNTDPVLQAEWTQKRLVWVPNEELGFTSASIIDEKPDKVTVRVVDTGKQMTLNPDDVQRMNPPKFDKVEDMAELTCLNEASVLHNLTQRYYSNQIYTYSSLFCLVVNPYKRLPIYSEKVLALYRGKKRYEVPPHVYAIADSAYHSMLYDRENQSILCTGESGAGKTENTKRVIQYLVFIGCKGAVQGAASVQDVQNKLEQQLLKANPILEAFGNAKTIKNDNSSRFGKFIQINFDSTGFINSTSVTTYILEKNRVSHQHEKERSYHIFYQLSKGASKEVKQEILYQDLGTYRFLTHGDVTVPSINDAQEFNDLISSMEIMEIPKEDIDSMFKTLSAIMLLGNIVFVQDKSSDQALLPNTEVAQKVCHLLKINVTDFTRSILKPRVKVGREFTTKTQTKAQVEFSTEALSKALYERVFKYIVAKINKALDKDRRTSPSFIGILDIAGFEIFEINSFEQLCINYTNEKLQQLFNHTMFILEQEEYQKEGIEWKFIDFGLDLQPTIDLLEKPIGVFGLLDEECWFPKATDKSYVEKLVKSQSNNPKFLVPDFRSNSDMIILHYAGKVNYTCTGWLAKNMDPLNDNVVELLSNSGDQYVSGLWKDKDSIVGLNAIQPSDSPFGASRAKKGMFRTVGQLYKEQLGNLMNNLRSTTSNFVRCIIPNYEKKPGKMTPQLILDQLRCNGVLEGIRICRQGYPNRIVFHEFKTRYEILTPGVIPQNFMDARKACETILTKLDLDKNTYRVGMSKVFFKSGVLANLEEERDKILYKYMVVFQAHVRGNISRRRYMKKTQLKTAVFVIQRNLKNYFELRYWAWWRLFIRIKPLLQITRQEDEMRIKEDELKRAKDKMEKAEVEVKDLESRVNQLNEERHNFLSKMEQDADALQDLEEKYTSITNKKNELEEIISDLEIQLQEEDQRVKSSKEELKRVESNLKELDEIKEKLENDNQKFQLDKVQLDAKLANLEQDLALQTDTASKLTKDKKNLEDKLTDATTKLQSEEEKVKQLTKLKSKNDGNLQEFLERIAQLEKIKAELEKERTRLEQLVNSLKTQINELQLHVGNLESQIVKKDKEISILSTKFEEEVLKRNDIERILRELQSMHDEVKEELETALSGKQKAEKQSKDLAHELENLRSELEQSLDTTAVQRDIQSKRESEVQILKRNLGEEAEKHELVLAELKARHNQLVQEMNDQLDALKKTKASLEKNKSQLESSKSGLTDELTRVNTFKGDIEKKLKQTEINLSEANTKLKKSEEEKQQLSNTYQKLKKEYDIYVNNHDQIESKLSTIESNFNKANTEASELREQLQDTTNAKVSLQAKVSELQRLLTSEQEKFEEEEQNRTIITQKLADLQKVIDQIKVDNINIRQQCEDIEMAKKQTQKELENTVQKLQDSELKYSKLDKSKKKLQGEVDDLNLNLDRERQNTATLEKKQKKFDQMLAEEKANFDRVNKEKEHMEKNLRQTEAKVMTLTKQIDELTASLEDADKQKKQVQQELSGLLETKDDQGKSFHDLEKQKRSLENQLIELKAEKEEIEDELQISEDTKARIEITLNALKSNYDNELNSRDEALEEVRRSLTKQLREAETALEEERKSKLLSFSSKKKMEGEVKSLQEQLDDALKAKDDYVKQIKRISIQIKELQREVEDSRISKDEALSLSRENEKKIKQLESDLAKLREDLSLIDRQKKQLENERDELQAEVAKLSMSQGIPEEKRRLEAALAELQDDLDDEKAEKDSLNERLRKYQIQVEQLVSDYNHEKSNASTFEMSKQSLEKQNRDLKNVISELESQLKTKSKNAMLESKIASLQDQLDTSMRDKTTLQKSLRRAENKCRDLEGQLTDERSQTTIAREQLEKGNSRLKQLKNQIVDQEEEISRLNSTKRKLQADLDEQIEQNEAISLELKGNTFGWNKEEFNEPQFECILEE